MHHEHLSARRRTASFRTLTTAAAFALLLIASLACSSTVDESIDQSFTVGSRSRVEIDNFNGAVRVKSGSSGVVRFEGDITRANQIEYDLRQEGDSIVFESELAPEFTGEDSPRVDIVITVPAETELAIDTGNGRFEILGLRGSGQLNTGNGEISFEDSHGDFSGNSGNGKITLVNVSGEFDLNSGNGDINVSPGQGAFTINTGNGSAELDDVSGSFAISTGNGKIQFSGALNPGGRNSFNSGNGSIELVFDTTPDIALDAETKRGEVRNELELDTIGLDQTRHLTGTIGDGSTQLVIGTGGGDIVLR
jgi:hypothetical protein